MPDAPVQAGPWRCTTDPGVETYLRCGRCERPICPRCMIQTPVGSRCRECARLRRPPLYDPSPLDYARGVAGGLGTAFLAGLLLTFVLAGLPMGGFIGIFVMAGVGYLVGEATTRVARRRRGTGMGTVAAVAVPLGLILARAVLFMSRGADPFVALAAASTSLAFPIWGLLGVIVGAAVAFSRLR